MGIVKKVKRPTTESEYGYVKEVDVFLSDTGYQWRRYYAVCLYSEDNVLYLAYAASSEESAKRWIEEKKLAKDTYTVCPFTVANNTFPGLTVLKAVDRK